jgi:hypothetical protein
MGRYRRTALLRVYEEWDVIDRITLLREYDLLSLTNTLPFCKIWLYGKVQLTFWYYRKLFLKCSSNQSSLYVRKLAQEKFVLNFRHVYMFYSTIKYFDFIIFISIEIIHWYLCHSSRVAKSDISFVVFCRSLFVLLSFFFLTLYCLPFFFSWASFLT